jgi:hypothetical protein
VFSQVTKTSAILKHAIHLETLLDLVTLAFLLGQALLLKDEALDLRSVALSS